jgi:hypothetical protein
MVAVDVGLVTSVQSVSVGPEGDVVTVRETHAEKITSWVSFLEENPRRSRWAPYEALLVV